jgi:hypothetical protein
MSILSGFRFRAGEYGTAGYHRMFVECIADGCTYRRSVNSNESLAWHVDRAVEHSNSHTNVWEAKRD